MNVRDPAAPELFSRSDSRVVVKPLSETNRSMRSPIFISYATADQKVAHKNEFKDKSAAKSDKNDKTPKGK